MLPVLKISFRGPLCLFLPLLVAACADAPATTAEPAATAAPVAEQVSQANANPTRHCETVDTTGSRTHHKTICRSDEEDSQDHDQIDSALTKVDTQPPAMGGGR
jgi:hypothetical protein